MIISEPSEEEDIAVPFQDEDSAISSSLYVDELGVHINHHLLQKEASLMRIKRCTNTSLGDGLISCPSSRIILLGYPLGYPLTYLPTNS